MGPQLQAVLRALERQQVKRAASGWIAKCPAHEDHKASLSIGEGEGGSVLLFCHAGCTFDEVVARMGLEKQDLFPEKPAAGKDLGRIVAEYDYRDEKGNVLYQVVRYDPKDFRQRRRGPEGWTWKLDGTRRVLYRLPELLKAPPALTVFLTEGEKDADRLAALGLVVTTNVGGAGKWRPEYNSALLGRHVVILPDNDQPGQAHAEQVTNALTGIAASVRTLALPGLPSKGDVSDWLDAGGTVKALLEMRSPSEATPPPPGPFQRSPIRIRGERADRISAGACTLSFGVQFLDHALGGITPRDLVLIGAKTGIGKTAMAATLALHNCREGKRVHYFALEAEEREIERRIKFQVIAAEYYRTGFARRPIRYLDWYMGRLDDELGSYEEAAEEALEDVWGNLHTFYRQDSFTTDDFCTQLQAIKNETDLVILDHLHYVDTDDDNENRAYKQTLKQIRDSAIVLGKPVIVVAHVRKGDRRFEPLVPTIEDFHGSSDIPKIATKAVMLAGAYDVPNKQPYWWNTYMQVLKCRLDGSLSRYIALVVFDNRTNTYAEGYVLGRLADGGKAFAHLADSEMPAWARRTVTTPNND